MARPETERRAEVRTSGGICAKGRFYDEAGGATEAADAACHRQEFPGGRDVAFGGQGAAFEDEVLRIPSERRRTVRRSDRRGKCASYLAAADPVADRRDSIDGLGRIITGGSGRERSGRKNLAIDDERVAPFPTEECWLARAAVTCYV